MREFTKKIRLKNTVKARVYVTFFHLYLVVNLCVLKKVKISEKIDWITNATKSNLLFQ